MAPEMIEAPKAAGTKADVWALGAILYRIVSGRYPFGSGWGAMKNILACKLPPQPDILTLRPQFKPLADQLWNLIEACLAVDPAKRPSADGLVSLCGELCYSSANRRRGTIQSYRDGSGSWGYLVADDGELVFYHRDSYYGQSPLPGTPVSFASSPGEPHARAFPVLPLRGAFPTED
jgi:serine/threonine protein kinase